MKSVKFLINVNILSYINCFLFSYFYTAYREGMKEHWGVLGAWALLPYVFAIITSFIMATDYKGEYKVFKVEAIIDWIIRIISFFIVFQEFSFTFLSKEYIITQVALMILFLLNISLEIRMYKKAKNYVRIEEKVDEFEDISEEEKKNIKNIGKASILGVISFIGFSAFGLSVVSTEGRFTLIVAIIAFILFLKANYKKCNLFFLDESYAKRIFIRDSIYATIGFLICLLSRLNVFESGSIINSYSLILAVILLYPTVRTNRKIGLRYKKLKKVLGDKFQFYLFNDYEDVNN